MNTDLNLLLEEAEHNLAESLFNQLLRSDAPRYKNAGVKRLRERCDRIVRELRAAVTDTPSRFAEYIQKITEERISEGYHLKEVQMALSFFEQEIWRLCAERFADRDVLLKCLTQVTWIIGSAKDELARIYLDHKRKADAAVAALEKRLADLFKGTATPGVPEEELI